MSKYRITLTDEADVRYAEACRAKAKKLTDDELIRFGKKAVAIIRLFGVTQSATAMLELSILRAEYKRRKKSDTAEPMNAKAAEGEL